MDEYDVKSLLIGVTIVLFFGALSLAACTREISSIKASAEKREKLEREMCQKHRDNGWPVERRKESCLDKYPELAR